MKDLWNKFLRPSGRALVLTYILTLLFITASMLMLLVDYSGSILEAVAYITFALSAIGLAYSIYTVVIYARGFRGRIISLLLSREFTRRLLESFGFRTVMASTATFFLTLVNSAFNAYLGISERSIWFGALAAYYVFLALMRLGLLLYHRAKKDYGSEGLIRAKKYTRCGVLLLILNAAISSAIAQMIFDDRAFEYKDWLIYAFAAYAFYKIITSAINVLKAQKQDDLTVRAIREINLVDAAMSILALQTALLHTFGDSLTDASLFNTLTGCFVSAFSLSLSIFMIIKGTKTVKELKRTNARRK